jgi:hypothetical protein
LTVAKLVAEAARLRPSHSGDPVTAATRHRGPHWRIGSKGSRTRSPSSTRGSKSYWCERHPSCVALGVGPDTAAARTATCLAAEPRSRGSGSPLNCRPLGLTLSGDSPDPTVRDHLSTDAWPHKSMSSHRVTHHCSARCLHSGDQKGT